MSLRLRVVRCKLLTTDGKSLNMHFVQKVNSSIVHITKPTRFPKLIVTASLYEPCHLGSFTASSFAALSYDSDRASSNYFITANESSESSGFDNTSTGNTLMISLAEEMV
mmetsp:Transcript_15316/g.22457  ORF Transcript_15316/g.22457 Transcript_15316/m.22457 type:complete len:110 (-) Transcript_15316:443-772(-)